MCFVVDLVRVDIVSDIGIAKGWLLKWKFGNQPQSRYIEVDFAISDWASS